jgi:hypothetical protein
MHLLDVLSPTHCAALKAEGAAWNEDELAAAAQQI